MEKANKMNQSPQNQPGSVTEKKQRIDKPSSYEVLLLNDDYTPMDFVVELLQGFFKYDYESAVQIMLQIHNNQSARVGVYSKEIAETKVYQVNGYARSNQHPLLCIMKKVESDA